MSREILCRRPDERAEEEGWQRTVCSATLRGSERVWNLARCTVSAEFGKSRITLRWTRLAQVKAISKEIIVKNNVSSVQSERIQ